MGVRAARSTMLLALCLAAVLATPCAARADWDDRPDPSEFEQGLAPSGYWADDPGFGRVWRPYEAWGWRPYVDGRWVWTSYGWTWVSPEPWAWTFHYGRWGFSNLHGWVWIPGYVWGPAWVDWYWGDGYVGWVPLGPPGFAVVPSSWVYVHDYHFCAPHLTTVIVSDRVLPDYIVHHREHGWGRARPPEIRDIEVVSRHQIVREPDRPRQSIAPWVQHRLERGEPVRERVADRGGERVIEHGMRRPTPTPPVANDGAWRRGAGQRVDGGGQHGMSGRTDHGVTVIEPSRRHGDADVGAPQGPTVQPGWTGPHHRAPAPHGGTMPRTLGGVEHPTGGGLQHRGGSAAAPSGGAMPHGGGSPQRGGGAQRGGGSSAGGSTGGGWHGGATGAPAGGGSGGGFGTPSGGPTR